MKINYHEDNFPYIVIENTYTKEELDLIWEELNFLCYKDKLISPEKKSSASAIDYDTGEILKNNMCIWLEDCYKRPEFSNIEKVNTNFFDQYFDKIFDNHPSWYFKTFQFNYKSTLISYYENGGYYKPHSDVARVTCLTWLFKEPKKFTGGELTLSHENTEITFQLNNNVTVIFPGSITHSVSKVVMDENECDSKKGRFCLTQFLFFRGDNR